ncbi:unnamed protein product [Linum trigynum]|uniref:non-specific serine/threonine protein kinase n=1 Tax=Linum trigynum TaxID=586398 RepID=A0AAV2F2S6_9ROSI
MGDVAVVVPTAAVLIIITTLTAAAPLSFNFTDQICSDAAVKLYGYASCAGPAIQLTPFDFWATGQARHPRPMHLWDRSTGQLANFTTDFTFAIDNNNGSWKCDGLAFFLAPHDYVTPAHADSGRLGLVHGNFTYNSTAVGPSGAFVAVEFDTYNDAWDTWHDGLSHVGINVDSMQSVASKRWRSHVDGRTTTWVRVSYEAKKKKLCVVYNTTTVEEETLCYGVDLRDYLPEWVVLGFSASTAFRYQSHTIKSWSFSSDLDGNYQDYITSTTTTTAGIIMRLILLVVGIVLIGSAALAWWMVPARVFSRRIYVFAVKNKEREEEENGWKEDDEEFSSGIPLLRRRRLDRSKRHSIDEGAKSVPLAELKRATKDFSEFLGRGGFGMVYKGQLASGQLIAAKKVPLDGAAMEGFMAELVIITQLRHENLVRLLGWSNNLDESCYYLIYEYMENLSLDLHLYGDGNGRFTMGSVTLDWEKRYRIVKGLANALSYLQAGGDGKSVLHGDVKSSNVLLDFQFNAKLGDFGMARVVDQDMRSHAEHGGTPAYMAPERADQRRAALESDTYSFGVVALEVASGRRAVVLKEHIVRWVWEIYGRGNVFEAVDPRLEGEFDRDEMQRLLMVGLHCAHPNRIRRLSIQDALRVLSDMKLPLRNFNLPLQYPPTRDDPPVPLLVPQILEDDSL